MKILVKYSFMFVVLTGSVLAAGKGADHVPSIKDLFYPAINFVVLVSFLVWKLKKPMKEMFNKKADEVKTLMTSAAEKNKDAEVRLKLLQTKINNIDSELTKIRADYDKDISNFMQNQATETQSIISRTKRDLENKLEGERKELVESMNEELLSQVIAKTKQVISSNNDFKSKATSKIVSELR